MAEMDTMVVVGGIIIVGAAIKGIALPLIGEDAQPSPRADAQAVRD